MQCRVERIAQFGVTQPALGSVAALAQQLGEGGQGPVKGSHFIVLLICGGFDDRLFCCNCWVRHLAAHQGAVRAHCYVGAIQGPPAFVQQGGAGGAAHGVHHGGVEDGLDPHVGVASLCGVQGNLQHFAQFVIRKALGGYPQVHAGLAHQTAGRHAHNAPGAAAHLHAARALHAYGQQGQVVGRDFHPTGGEPLAVERALLGFEDDERAHAYLQHLVGQNAVHHSLALGQLGGGGQVQPRLHAQPVAIHVAVEHLPEGVCLEHLRAVGADELTVFLRVVPRYRLAVPATGRLGKHGRRHHLRRGGVSRMHHAFNQGHHGHDQELMAVEGLVAPLPSGANQVDVSEFSHRYSPFSRRRAARIMAAATRRPLLPLRVSTASLHLHMLCT